MDPLPDRISEEDALRFELFAAKLALLKAEEQRHADAVVTRYGINLDTDIIDLPSRAIRRGAKQG